METVSYHFHFNGYEVIGTTTYLVLDLEKLVDYHPLGSYKINNMLFIQLRHQKVMNNNWFLICDLSSLTNFFPIHRL